ncbi:MAG TPA: LCP family protein [Dermatophilaceae bacterium]|nr:LCP family protein [Dermatophilaceae bacterium]
MLDTLEPTAERPGEPRRPRWGRRILAVLVAVVLLVVAGVGGYLLFLSQTVSGNVTREALLPTGEGAQPVTPAGEPVPTEGVGRNYLVVGSDARPGETASRADVIILAHVSEDRGQVHLVHFPRDLYVPIPGRGEDKINAAYAYGGAPLLVRTVQDLLGVRIDHVAKTDFEGFKAMTDAVGGVRVYAEEASGGSGNGGDVAITQGWNDLDGEGALAFVRERYELSEGDISRGKRQQAFIKALMLEALSRDTLTNPVRLARFLDAATENLVVDEGLDAGTMRSEAFALRGLRSADVVFVTAPFTGYGRSPSGASIDVLDEAGMERLGEALRTDDMASWTDTTVIP